MKTILHYTLMLIALMTATSAHSMEFFWSTTVGRADYVVPYQLEVLRNPFYLGLDAPANTSYVIKVWELGPNGSVSGKPRQTRTVTMPRVARYGIDKWTRIRGLTLGKCYAVSIASANGALRSIGYRLQDFLPKNPTGQVIDHYCADPLHSPCPWGTSSGRSLSAVVIDEIP